MSQPDLPPRLTLDYQATRLGDSVPCDLDSSAVIDAGRPNVEDLALAALASRGMIDVAGSARRSRARAAESAKASTGQSTAAALRYGIRVAGASLWRRAGTGRLLLEHELRRELRMTRGSSTLA
jgi:hypothetical protein